MFENPRNKGSYPRERLLRKLQRRHAMDLRGRSNARAVGANENRSCPQILEPQAPRWLLQSARAAAELRGPVLYGVRRLRCWLALSLRAQTRLQR